MSESAATSFEPAKHLTKVSGSEYLEVKWRLVWLRDAHPNASVITTLLSHGDNTAVFQAHVEIPGGGIATGHGSESAGDFRDYLEKAETKAIGRALAALGFGTQFCPDHEFGASVGRVVDAPVRKSPQQSRGAGVGNAPPRVDKTESSIRDQPATDRQLRYLQAVAKEAGMDPEQLDGMSTEHFGHVTAHLGRRDASSLIDIIQSAHSQ